jgi:hypothetical protein
MMINPLELRTPKPASAGKKALHMLHQVKLQLRAGQLQQLLLPPRRP